MPSKRKTKKKKLVAKKKDGGRTLKVHHTGMHEETGELVDIDDMLDAQVRNGHPRVALKPKDSPPKRPWRRKTALDIAEGMEFDGKGFDPEFVHPPD